MINDIKKSILSGLMICIGGTVYLSCLALNLRPLGAFLFAAGLYTICMYGFNLYTGKVGYIAYNFKDTKHIRLVILTLSFNLLSTYILGIMAGYAFPLVVEPAKEIFYAKTQTPILRLFISGLFCGILMFLSVDTWKKGSKAGVFIYIPVFILCGFDHSIANSFYNGIANGLNAFTPQNVLIFISVILGNAAGGMLIPLLTRNFSKTACPE